MAISTMRAGATTYSFFTGTQEDLGRTVAGAERTSTAIGCEFHWPDCLLGNGRPQRDQYQLR